MALLSCAACVLPVQESASAAQAASYPAKPIRVVAPFTPGGGSDLVARIVAQRLTDAFKQQCIVENRAGAGGRVGTEYVARAAPDGYTLLLTGSGSVIFATALYEKLPYDVQRDLSPVTTVASSSFVLVVHPAVPAQSVKQLLALARARPASLNYASSGAGAPAHLAAELFQASTKVKLTHVPYKGTAPSVASVMAGETDLTFGNILTVVPPVQSGKLRALGVSTLKRSALFPQVPTIAESGVPGFETVTYYGVFAPAGTPQEIVTLLNAVLVKGLHTDDTRKRLTGDGSEVLTSTPEEFARVIKADIEKWTRVVKAAGIKPE